MLFGWPNAKLTIGYDQRAFPKMDGIFLYFFINTILIRAHFQEVPFKVTPCWVSCPNHWDRYQFCHLKIIPACRLEIVSWASMDHSLMLTPNIKWSNSPAKPFLPWLVMLAITIHTTPSNFFGPIASSPNIICIHPCHKLGPTLILASLWIEIAHWIKTNMDLFQAL